MEQPPPDGRTRHGSHGYEVTQARGSQVVSRSPSGRNSPSTPPKRVKLSNRFKRLLATATTLPVLALILMVCTTFSPQWERVEFAFDKVVRFACSTPASQSRTWSLAYLILETGSRIPFDKNEVHACREACGRLFNRTQAGEAQKSVVGAGLLKLSTNANTTSNTTTLIEVYNMLAGVFQVCYKTQVPMERGLMAIIKAPLRTSASCFNYILNGPRWKGSGCRLMMLRMQNNLIACVIIVFLCIISSFVVGSVSVLARIVPAALVNAFLYLTACVFIVFANCIEHIKVIHIRSKWGPCYPISDLPPELYNPQMITVHYGWPVYLNWAAVSVFLGSTCAWFTLKRILFVETSKAII